MEQNGERQEKCSVFFFHEIGQGILRTCLGTICAFGADKSAFVLDNYTSSLKIAKSSEMIKTMQACTLVHGPVFLSLSSTHPCRLLLSASGSYPPVDLINFASIHSLHPSLAVNTQSLSGTFLVYFLYPNRIVDRLGIRAQDHRHLEIDQPYRFRLPGSEEVFAGPSQPSITL